MVMSYEEKVVKHLIDCGFIAVLEDLVREYEREVIKPTHHYGYDIEPRQIKVLSPEHAPLHIELPALKTRLLPHYARGEVQCYALPPPQYPTGALDAERFEPVQYGAGPEAYRRLYFQRGIFRIGPMQSSLEYNYVTFSRQVMRLCKPVDSPTSYLQPPSSVDQDITYTSPSVKELKVKVTFRLNPHEAQPRGEERPAQGVLALPKGVAAEPEYGVEGRGPLAEAGLRHPHEDLRRE